MQDPQPGLSKKGAPGIAGTCPTCGGNLFRRLKSAGEEREKPAKKTKKAKKATTGRGSKLVIVESPTKARTIQRYLGRGYSVKASVGHVRDLLRSKLSVDTEDNYAPTYRIPNDKRAVVKDLKKAVEGASQVFLATDLDREGEAIAWHVMEATDLEPERARRVVFHEITKEAIAEAFAHPRAIDDNLVDAQQARRILDRLVGYQLTPLLWEKVRGRLSAGRVQSVTVRLIVEREREIRAFVPEEYWTLDALLAKAGQAKSRFKAGLAKIDGADFELGSQAGADAVVKDLDRAAFTVESVKTGTRKRSPSPPFITSTLQQEASKALGFQAARTMRVAQQLYEGVELGSEGSVGLITYMRTDSVHVAESALSETREVVKGRFGPEFLPDKAKRFRTRSKSAQEAHEAIRPTSVSRTPEMLAPHLSRDQLTLYRLIWRRMVASQMKSALYDTLSVEVAAVPVAGERTYLFRASGSTLRFPGYLAAYGESAKDDSPSIPPLKEGEPLDLIELLPEQHFTQAPPRYNEASLIRALESKGIGRPSTYASIISTVIARGYVERQQRNLVPTDTAFVVNDLLVQYFPKVLDAGFTAQMETDLDEIAAGHKEWVPVVDEFYRPFHERLEHARAEMESVKVEDEPAGEDCEKCGAPMVIKFGRFGKFIGCSNYPECKNTKPFLEKVGVDCPKCGADLVRRRSRKGRPFYGCSAYPECDFATNSTPLPQKCSSCGGFMVQKGKKAECTACEHREPIANAEEESEAVAEEA